MSGADGGGGVARPWLSVATPTGRGRCTVIPRGHEDACGEQAFYHMLVRELAFAGTDGQNVAQWIMILTCMQHGREMYKAAFALGAFHSWHRYQAVGTEVLRAEDRKHNVSGVGRIIGGDCDMPGTLWDTQNNICRLSVLNG